MKQRQWRRPPTAAATSAAAPGAAPDVSVIVGPLARAVGTDVLTIERQRLAGRSDIFILRADASGRCDRRWVVKRPHTGWSQDDVGSPLSAREEFDALGRLHRHFERLQTPTRVPTPVAYFPELDAFAMEFVDGVTLKNLLDYRSLLHPRALLNGIEAAGEFLRRLHALEQLPDVDVDLRDEAQTIVQVAEEKLHPLGLELPERVRRTLDAVPSTRVTSRQVRLHGDFGPANIILASDGSTVGLDADLSRVGRPEHDLARFVALVAGVIRLSPEIAFPPLTAVRRLLEGQLLRSYYQGADWPPLFELTYLHQLSRRWCRLRELASQHQRNALLPVKLSVIGHQVRGLMRDSELRLVHALEAS